MGRRKSWIPRSQPATCLAQLGFKKILYVQVRFLWHQSQWGILLSLEIKVPKQTAPDSEDVN